MRLILFSKGACRHMRSFAPACSARIVYSHVFVAAIVLAGCGTKEAYRNETFKADTPFSKKIQGSGDAVCFSVKRAFLSQGYMLDRSSDSVIMTGTKDSQVDDETNVTLRLQTSCVDNKDGSSTVFASASQEVSKLQSAKTSTSAGVGIFTVTVPTSEKSLRALKREAIQDVSFYQRFYSLVQNFAEQERKNMR